MLVRRWGMGHSYIASKNVQSLRKTFWQLKKGPPNPSGNSNPSRPLLTPQNPPDPWDPLSPQGPPTLASMF